MGKLSSRSVIEIVLAFWVIVAACYLNHTPPDTRNSDYFGHIEYSMVIARDKKIPKPYGYWLSYNPPLYYLINSFIARKSLLGNNTEHINYVWDMSVLYGAISLLVIWWILRNVTQDTKAQLITLLFICTTPMFVIVFASYNNDSLATMLSIALCAVAYKLRQSWSWKFGILLLVLATFGSYTKYTFLWCILVICLLCCRNLLFRKLPDSSCLRIIGILFLSFILFMPWLVFRNYQHTGKFFPFNDEELFIKRVTFSKIANNLIQRLNLPVLSEVKTTWKEPFTYPLGGPYTKRYNYWSYSFVTSIMSEWVYKKPNVFLIWLMIWIHLILYLAAICSFKSSGVTKLATASILLVHLFQIAYISRLNNMIGLGFSMNYRYICWSWICWATLYASLLSVSSSLRYIFNRLMLVGIVVHVYFLLVVEGSSYS